MCCCTIGGGPPDNATWVKWFRKDTAGRSGDAEAADGDEAAPDAKGSDDDNLAYLDELLTFYDLPDFAPW